ncbi:MAG: 4-hydroxy-tetrahydrodipicolinate reductase, partial [Nitratireductor sp.]|nr:4-hydroxy-tetrahydrodipicolinate reductase [Nitratireductor sp.]
MKLVVVGAGGRMGLALIQAISRIEGVSLSAAIEREGSPALGKDSGLLAGIGENGIVVSDDALAAFAAAEGVLDFTAPAASVEFAALAAQARIVHVIGTTGCSAADEEK